MRQKSQMAFMVGEVGNIEVRLMHPSTEKPDMQGKWVVLSHPHPQFGGTMDNKVVTTLEKSFQVLGYGTLAYQFRGVGQSAGEYDGGVGEQQDLVAVVTGLRAMTEVRELVLAGFSFGSYISLMQANGLQADKILTVAPPVNLYDFSVVNIHKNCEWVLVQGGQDEVVPALEVLDWATQVNNPSPDIFWRAEASHFFHRQLVWLKQVIFMVY